MVDNGNFIEVAIEIKTPATIKLTDALIISKAGALILWSFVINSFDSLKLLSILLFIEFGITATKYLDNKVLPFTILLESIFG